MKHIISSTLVIATLFCVNIFNSENLSSQTKTEVNYLIVYSDSDTSKAKTQHSKPLPNKVAPAVFNVENDKPVEKTMVYPSSIKSEDVLDEEIRKKNSKE